MVFQVSKPATGLSVALPKAAAPSFNSSMPFFKVDPTVWSAGQGRGERYAGGAHAGEYV